MFEVMTLVTCDGTRVAGAGSPIGGQNRGSDDGPPGGGGWVPVETFGAITAVMGPQVAGLGTADDAGSEVVVAVVPHRDGAGLYHQEPRTHSRAARCPQR